MASVYAATHRNGQTAALKILHASLANEKGIRDRFLREGYVGNSVGHPGVVAVLDDDTTEEDAPFLIMELLIGQTLSKRWKKLSKRMPIPEALHIASPVLDCLSACHAASVIHRDLKPPNIFLTEDGRVKILDFGVAQLRDATAEKTRTGTALGTPYYMSPEQAMGLVDQLDGRADIFSVGAILHALITGQRIHNARTENEALILAATTPVPSVARVDPNLPIEVIKLIDKALAWDRRNRYDDALAMREAVLETLALLEGHAPPVAAPVAVAPAQVAPAPVAYGAPQAPAAPVAPAAPEPAQYVAPPQSQARAQPPAYKQAQAQPPQPPPTQRAPIAAPVEETADADDPRVEEAHDLFKHVDRLLPTVRQLGWGHPATERAVRTTFEAFAAALARNPRAVSLKVRPYSFLILNQTAWEPSPPFDTVPYNLFAAGMRTFELLPGIQLDEFRETMALMLIDPGQDLPPEDDMVSALWDRGLTHVVYETTDPFADGDAGQREAFLDETDELENLAAQASAARTNLIEAKAMAVSTDRNALAPDGGPSPMSIDQNMQLAFAPQLEVTRDQWSERYVDVLVDGLREAIQNGDPQLVFGSLRKSASDLVVAGRLGVAIGLHRAIAGRLKTAATLDPNLRGAVGELTDSMFGGDTLRIFLDRLGAEPELANDLEPILNHLSASELTAVLGALQKALPPPVRQLLLSYVERTARGNEEDLALAIPGLDPLVMFPLLELLKRVNTPEARKALGELGNSKDIAVRIEAKILAAGTPEAVEEELTTLLNDKSIGVRIASLRALSRHGLKRVVAAVTRRINATSFGSLVPEERRELFTTVIFLAPDRGEALALEVAKKGGLFTNESREVSRVAAIDALGAASSSRSVAQALNQIAQSRWATSDDTRSRAAAAAAQVEARAGSAGGGGTPS